MKDLVRTLMVLSALAASPALAQTMEVSPNGARASVAGPAETFTGVVTVTPLFAANEFSNASADLVQFTPGARSAWHTHPAGQTLVVTEGMGWVQQEGGEKIEIRPGDVIQDPARGKTLARRNCRQCSQSHCHHASRRWLSRHMARKSH